MTRYYSTQRPVDLGTYPTPAGNRVKEIVNFDSRIECPEIGRPAWGYLEYESELAPEDAKSYELVKA